MHKACGSLRQQMKDLYFDLLKYRIRRSILLLPWGAPKKANTVATGLRSMPTKVPRTCDPLPTPSNKSDQNLVGLGLSLTSSGLPGSSSYS